MREVVHARHNAYHLYAVQMKMKVLVRLSFLGVKGQGKIYSLRILNYILMPPTSKKLKGHIAFGLSFRPCTRPSARYKFKRGL